MTRVLLFLLFVVMLMADTLGLKQGLAPGLSIKNAFLYLIFVSIAIDTALRRNREFELLSVSMPLFLVVFYTLFGWLIVVLFDLYRNYSAIESFMRLKSLLADNLIVFLVYFYGILNSKDAVWLLKSMIWAVMLGNAISVVDALNMPDLGLIDLNHRGRLGGPFDEANQYAAFLAMFLPISVGLAVIEKGWRRNMAILGTLVSVLAFLMTASRGGLVGLFGGTLIGAYFLRRFLSGRAIGGAVIGVLAIIVVAVPTLYAVGLGEFVFGRLIGVSSSGTAYDASSGRTFVWAMTMDRMFEYPVTLLTGFGWDTYRQFPDFSLATHNSYLLTYFETGLIGLFLVLLTYLNILRAARSALWSKDADAAKLIMPFVIGFTGVILAASFAELYTPWILIWAYIGVVLRYSILQNAAWAPQTGRRRPFATPRPSS